MKRIKFDECNSKEFRNLLDTKEEVVFIAEKEFDTNLLIIINEQCQENFKLFLKPNKKGISVELLQLIPNIQRLNISPDYENRLETLNGLSGLTNLIELAFGMYVKGNVSFEPIGHINTLLEFDFGDQGLESKPQYEFINKQRLLKKLHANKLDLSILLAKSSLRELRIHSTLKNENLLAEKFPNLKKFHLHGDKHRQNHSFIQNLLELENIEINYCHVNFEMTVFCFIFAPN